MITDEMSRETELASEPRRGRRTTRKDRLVNGSATSQRDWPPGYAEQYQQRRTPKPADSYAVLQMQMAGLRDRAMFGVMVYSFGRVGAVVGMNVEDYFQEGKRWWFRLHEKGGKRCCDQDIRFSTQWSSQFRPTSRRRPRHDVFVYPELVPRVPPGLYIYDPLVVGTIRGADAIVAFLFGHEVDVGAAR